MCSGASRTTRRGEGVGGGPARLRRRALGSVHEIGRLLTAAEAAERLGYTERYVCRLGREGVLPRVKLPGRKYVRFTEADVERFVARHRVAVPGSSRGAGGRAAAPPPPRF